MSKAWAPNHGPIQASNLGRLHTEIKLERFRTGATADGGLHRPACYLQKRFCQVAHYVTLRARHVHAPHFKPSFRPPQAKFNQSCLYIAVEIVCIS